MRIVSLSPSATEILFAIGMGESIIANTIYCDYPPQAKQIPKAGSFIRIDIHKLQEMKADIIFTSSIVQQKISEELQTAGLPVCHTDPRSLTGIYQSIFQTAKAVGRIQQAKKIIQSMKAEEEKLRSVRHSHRLNVYIEEWFKPPMVSGNWVPDIVELAGGNYGIVQSGELSREVTLDEVINYDPDIILSSYCGFGKNSNQNHLLHRPGWKNLRAVKEKHLYNLDETILNRPGPRILQSVSNIQEALSQYKSSL
jgi:iron complex transport system substrate-binding protein